jgi:light-regulated signal transduction histidine kinase (bacteriophytochrome)
VIADETTMGVLWIARHAAEPFPEADLRLFLSIANLVAIALDRVSLHDDAVRQTRELAARNGELDRFAYVVSHDLKEPLIAIEGYTKIVLSGKANLLDDEGRNHLGSVVRSSGRMKQLIDDLLTLSRLDRVPGQVSAVEVPLLLEELLHDMAFTLRERNARVEYDADLPAVRYDATHLSMVFRNLISNGVKYNSNTEPLVRITAEEKPDRTVFSVADNGIGIPQEEAEKVFVIFHRLHAADRYAGTGAGLTIVKKIVDAYGGRIWLESSPGQGTTFHFSVPHNV